MATFTVGHKKMGGRTKGTPNKATVTWKQFVTDLCEDPAVQKSTKESILNGKAELIFKAAEHAFGKPTETVKITGEFKMIDWPDLEDVREDG